MLVTQQTKSISRIILSHVAYLDLPHFSTFSHKRHDFRGKLLSIKCVLFFSNSQYVRTGLTSVFSTTTDIYALREDGNCDILYVTVETSPQYTLQQLRVPSDDKVTGFWN
jgi:hypothetical protein